MAFKIASYNVENLFSRPILMNYANNETGTPKLAKVARLQELLAAESYAPHKAEIEALYGEIAPFIDINVQRKKGGGSSLFSGNREDGYRLTVAGCGVWHGFIELKRESFTKLQVDVTAKVIRDLNPDVMSVIEAEDRIALHRFNREVVKRQGLTYAMSVEGNDDRGIDVGLLSKHPLGRLRTNCFDKSGNSLIFSRDCLEVEILPAGKPPVHLLVNHFKSKGYGAQDTSDAKRKRQAERVVAILGERYNLAQDHVVVAGDLNDVPGSGPLAPLLAANNLFDVLAARPADDRWTYKYKNQFNQIDFLLVSKPLKDKLQDCGVYRKGMLAVPEAERYPEVKGWDTAASDHGAVWATFNL